MDDPLDDPLAVGDLVLILGPRPYAGLEAIVTDVFPKEHPLDWRSFDLLATLAPYAHFRLLAGDQSGTRLSRNPLLFHFHEVRHVDR